MGIEDFLLKIRANFRFREKLEESEYVSIEF